MVTATDETEGDTPDELEKELAVRDSAAEGIYETAGGNPEEPPRAAATEDDGATDDVPKEICKLNKVIRELFEADLEERGETEGTGPEEMLDDVTADDADNHDLRDTGQGDVVAGSAAGSDPKELGREAGLVDVATNMPLRRTQRFRKQTRKAAGFALALISKGCRCEGIIEVDGPWFAL